MNGTACILRTLCEVGARRSDTQADSFLAEIIRVIFSLPKSEQNAIEKRHAIYDEAHHHIDGNDCFKKYHQCEQSIFQVGISLKQIRKMRKKN